MCCAQAKATAARALANLNGFISRESLNESILVPVRTQPGSDAVYVEINGREAAIAIRESTGASQSPDVPRSYSVYNASGPTGESVILTYEQIGDALASEFSTLTAETDLVDTLLSGDLTGSVEVLANRISLIMEGPNASPEARYLGQYAIRMLHKANDAVVGACSTLQTMIPNSTTPKDSSGFAIPPAVEATGSKGIMLFIGQTLVSVVRAYDFLTRAVDITVVGDIINAFFSTVAAAVNGAVSSWWYSLQIDQFLEVEGDALPEIANGFISIPASLADYEVYRWYPTVSRVIPQIMDQLETPGLAYLVPGATIYFYRDSVNQSVIRIGVAKHCINKLAVKNELVALMRPTTSSSNAVSLIQYICDKMYSGECQSISRAYASKPLAEAEVLWKNECANDGLWAAEALATLFAPLVSYVPDPRQPDAEEWVVNVLLNGYQVNMQSVDYMPLAGTEYPALAGGNTTDRSAFVKEASSLINYTQFLSVVFEHLEEWCVAYEAGAEPVFFPFVPVSAPLGHSLLLVSDDRALSMIQSAWTATALGVVAAAGVAAGIKYFPILREKAIAAYAAYQRTLIDESATPRDILKAKKRSKRWSFVLGGTSADDDASGVGDIAAAIVGAAVLDQPAGSPVDVTLSDLWNAITGYELPDDA